MPWVLQQGQWETISLDEVNDMRKQEQEAFSKQDEGTLRIMETKASEVELVGAKSSATHWINRELGLVCVGLPPTMVKVGKKRILEQRNLNENETRKPKKDPDNVDISLVDYQAYFTREKQALQRMIDKINASIVIEAVYRGHMARKSFAKMKKQHAACILIQKRARGMIGRERVRILQLHMRTCLTLQRRRRGTVCRRRLAVLYPMLLRRRSVLLSARIINRVWRGYIARRAKRLLWWQKYGPKSQSEWSHLKDGLHSNSLESNDILDSGSMLLRSGIYHGKYDLYRVASTWDVRFYYDNIRGTCSWDVPQEVQSTIERERREDRELRIRGFTAEQMRVASKLQAIWRGKKMVEQFRVILKAKKIMRTCVDDYMREPHSIERTFNYMLYTHLFPPHDFDRARTLYVKAMETMTKRGPDHPSILYAFLIFSTATREEDDDVLFELWRRAKIADAARNQKRSAFELAEIGFYRMAAVFHPEDYLCQMNYAICLQWLRQDWEQAEQFYQRAAKLTHGREELVMENYNFMLEKLAGKTYSAEDALGSQIRQEAALANQEFALKVRRNKLHARALEDAAARTIQFRFRLRRQGLLKYWMWKLPSFFDLQAKLLRDFKKANGIEDDSPTVDEYEDPEEWEACSDGEGNTYYFNIKTGASTWESPIFHPSLVQAGIEVKKGPGWDVNNNESGKLAVSFEELEHADTLYDNPEEWEMLVCGDGSTYFYNTQTDFSTWRRPKFQNAEDYRKMKRVATESVEEAISRAENWDLEDEHPEWKVIIKKNFDTQEWERPYWYCESLGISLWEAPRFDAMGRLLGMNKMVNQKQPYEQNTIHETNALQEFNGNEELPQGWERCFDAQGNAYFYNETLGQSRWDISNLDGDQNALEGGVESNVDANLQSDHFELCYDENGNEYLYSEASGESVWLESGCEFDHGKQMLRNVHTGEWKPVNTL